MTYSVSHSYEVNKIFHLLPLPSSLFPLPYSLLRGSLLPTPYSLFPVHDL
ncbi:hypothetical protein [Moorena sp. SIO4G3]|nr:hypothetical protein [Moorena sp. SIO4G3]